MQRHQFLAALHRRLEPRNYLEIGVNDGRSLALARAPSIGIDPAFRITVEIEADAHLVKATSDAFFERDDPLAHFGGRRIPWRDLRHNRGQIGRWIRPSGGRDDAGTPVVDLAFIDGMHWFEYALRDFMHVERLTAPTSVIVFDDMLPRSVVEAARDRTTKFWAGDVYKMQGVLRSHRPDLLTIPIDTAPTGLLVVLAPNATDTVLRDRYDEIVATNVVPDPQAVPDAILRRDDALDPEAFLASGVCETIAQSRRDPSARDGLAVILRRDLEARPTATGGSGGDRVLDGGAPGGTRTHDL